MTHDTTVLVTRHERWLEIVLNRPEKGNALTMPMLAAIGTAVDDAARDRDLRAVVLCAAGERHFCTGGDIAAWGSLSPLDMAREWIERGADVLARIAALPMPVLAEINGHTIGGGLELALAADLRVAVAGATFGTPEVGLGMIPGWGGVGRLAEVVGPGRAAHLTLLGTPISAEEALSWGLVTAVAPDHAALVAQRAAWVETLCGRAPVAVALVKGLLAASRRDMRHQHASAAAQAAATDDCREGVRAFAEKRRPAFTNT
ncbi:acyl-CoA hydratase [Luteitalea sp. TBR-22]|uniref:enoyl-CoA hydratase/isomerase family protein n=1 Tax=Luteitalea sp. TBR-22 TaxID=2802971 RepID=UPI001AF48710|nr:enoyl-CoA hydratase/isomerase family protein [Luteitalea sp. TBR-22]BCS31729.1 acyl-CoA hydratase [Luteitalea sp. TBR-22]